MLRRLELIGFKSFAERTRFEFAPGITAIVGPNGSGKSNIVDAVRWLLGEQSAKNLRGGEMTDVIFNGSSTRKSLGLAEVTMTFDNSNRILNIDSDEVQIARRVFRDGEGECFINSQPARLKDIKELFLGTGAGHGAYSVIEQGRVDSLLAASNKERRVIFEEAAGVSRFKLKKQEALRKLESVQTDLTRVQDITREMEKQLKTLRQQAAKAQKYQEYQQRLRELRIASSAQEVHLLNRQIETEAQTVEQLCAKLEQAAEQSKKNEEQVLQLDQKLSLLVSQQQHHESELTELRRTIARLENDYSSELRRFEYLSSERFRLANQQSDCHRQLQRCTHELHQLREAFRFAEQRLRTEQSRAETMRRELQQTMIDIEQLTLSLNAKREAQLQAATKTATTETACQNVEKQLRTIEQALRQKQSESQRLMNRHAVITRVLAELSESDADVRERLETTRLRLSELQAQQASMTAREHDVRKELEALRERRSALRGRQEVLESLERSYEGLGAGVRYVLEKLANNAEPFSSSIVGLIADLIRVRREDAAIVELALGDSAERFMVRDVECMHKLIPHLNQLPGRVGLIPIIPRESFTIPPPLIGQPLTSLVSCNNPEMAQQLFQTIWLVNDLEDARTCQQTHPHWRFVTKAGELLDRDGTILVGPAEQRANLLSRKSELRELRTSLYSVEMEIRRNEDRHAHLLRDAASLSQQCQLTEDELNTITAEAGNLREQLWTQRQQGDQLSEAIQLLCVEQESLRKQYEELHVEEESLRRSLTEFVQQEDRLRNELNQYADAFREAESRREIRNSDYTTVQMTVNRLADQVQIIQSQVQHLENTIANLASDLNSIEHDLRLQKHMMVDSELTALKVSASIARSYQSKQDLQNQLRQVLKSLSELNSLRESLLASLRSAREEQAKLRDQLHSHDVILHEQTSRRDAILARIHEEFAVDLQEFITASGGLVQFNQPELGSSTDRSHEMAELKSKISKLGPVNLEALSELAEHEKQFTNMNKQLIDLKDSHHKIVQIIEQTNLESRRLMSETIEQVRVQFQDLFRKLFAGGHAEIVLEDESDLLESGIDIIVRPPGKETQRMSLLSGGERALTAVALLLAIFRSRPSPFCVLDEVDAAMDEGNTQRLANLLREFSHQSQFVIITHKKRTMAAADVLYGVTMQESGVSKLVAVRFEDWQESTTMNRFAA